MNISHAASRIKRKINLHIVEINGDKIRKKYADFTMISRNIYVANLVLCSLKMPREGAIVECGVWRGGMSAGIADMFPGRHHALFDSFEGLPPAKPIDGQSAIDWQNDKGSPAYFDNCSAEQAFAEKAMGMSAAGSFRLVRGWFSDTLPGCDIGDEIGLLRLDGDWYESTMDCLVNLYPKVRKGGLIIIDDYYAWDGCARAVHDFLSQHQLAERIEEFAGVAHIVKRGDMAAG